MDFKNWLINESSLNDLYQSTVITFPRCQKRQHAIQPIQITEVRYTPFVGVRTLLVRSIAKNENRQYSPMILFKNVRFHEAGPVRIVVENRQYHLDPVSIDDTQVLTRCDCKDFFWRGNYAASLDHSLYGTKRTKYEPTVARESVNPSNAPMMCKHLIKLMKVIEETGLIR